MNRSQVLGSVVLLLVVAVIADSRVRDARQEPGVVPATVARNQRTVAMPPAQTPVEAALPAAVRDPFYPARVAPAPRPKPVVAASPVVAVAAPPPAAPQVPFQYLGTIVDAKGRVAKYVASGATMTEIDVGSNIDGVWRIDAIEQSHLVVTYLPLGSQHSVPR